jgi:hypothetical protein
MVFPKDDTLLGETDINLFLPGNGCCDGTGQAETHAYWFGDQFGLPFLYCRPVFIIVNGVRRATIYNDMQQPNGDFVDQWFPDDNGGELHKIQLGFEFGDTATGANEAGYGAVGATRRPVAPSSRPAIARPGRRAAPDRSSRTITRTSSRW